MSSPMPVMPLIRRVLNQIDAHPETWDQQWFGIKTECGTAFCFAGHAVVLSGRAEPKWTDYNDGEDVLPVWFTAGDNDERVDVLAANVLGLTDEEQLALFDVMNSRDDLEFICREIAARAGEPLWPDEPEVQP